MTRTTRHLRIAGILAAGAALAAPLGAQRGSLPFAPGESCVYRGTSPLGRMGSGTFSVARDDSAAGAWVLRFDFRGRMGIVGVENHTRSFFNPAETASFRFTKTERSPLSTKRQDVRMDAGTRRWTGTGRNAGGAMATDAPLDELSFIYFLRTLRLGEGDTYNFTRHYDPTRNPVRVRVIGRGLIRVPAGSFQAIEVEMRVRDPNRYGGEGVIQIHFTDDERHVPIRLESQIPVAGRKVLSLEAMTPSCGAAGAAERSAD
jgi:hypothetical protein